MATEFQYPNNINLPEFKYRRIKINVFKPKILNNARNAIDNAKQVLGDFYDLVATSDTSIDEIQETLKKHADLRIRGTGEFITSITLPLPNNFQDSQSHGWSTETGVIGTIGQSLTGTTVGSVINKLTGGRVGGPDVSIDKVIGATSSTLGSRKPIVDPGYFQNYTGSEPRQFSTEFNFIPGSVEEAEQILSIIMKLKQYSSPTRQVAGVSLLAPYFFNLEFSNKYIESMIKVDRVVLKDLSFDYGADGAMQMTGDGVPKFITASLTWQEVDLTTATEYDHIPKLKENTGN